MAAAESPGEKGIEKQVCGAAKTTGDAIIVKRSANASIRFIR